MRLLPCLLAAGVTVYAVGGCTVGPNYTPPKPPDVAAWNDPSARPPGHDPSARPPGHDPSARPPGHDPSAQLPDHDQSPRAAVHPVSTRAAATMLPQTDPDPLWWNGFGDPVLTELM